MATLIITCYKSLASDGGGSPVPVPEEPDIGGQVVTFTTAASSAPFPPGTRFVKIQSAVACNVKFGLATATFSATAADNPIAADTPSWHGVSSRLKLSVYDGSS